MIDADIAAQVLGNNASSQQQLIIDPDIAAQVLEPENNEVSKTKSFFMGAGKQLAKIGDNIATTVAAGTDKIGLTNNAQKSIKNAFDTIVHPFYNQEATANTNPGISLAGNIAGGIIGSAPALLSAPGKLYQFGTGAISGWLNSDPNASALEKTKNAAIGGGLNMIPGGPALAATGGAVLGGGTAYLTGDDIGTGATIGAGAGLALYGAGRYGKNIPYVTQPISTIVKGIKPTATSPSDLAEIATQRTLEKVGGDMSKTTPEMALKELDKLTKAARVRKNNDYDALYAQADAEGVKVTKNNLASLVDDLTGQVEKGATSETVQVLREAKRLLGKPQKTTTTQAGKILGNDGKPLMQTTSTTKPQTTTYKDMYDLVSDIGRKINTANRQGNYALANKLTPIKDALLTDIKAGGGSDALQVLKTEADNFYSNVYSPLRNADAARILAERQAEGAYIASAVKRLLNDKELYGAFAAGNRVGLKNTMEETIASAHINALKDSATTDGMINPTKYASALSTTLRDNPVPLRSVTDKITALGKALEVAKQSQGLRGQSTQHSLGQKIGMGMLNFGAVGGTGFMLGGPMVGAATAGAAYLLPKTKYLYTAGKMLKNPETAALLGRAAKISDKTDPAVANAIYKQVAAKFEKYNSYMSPRLLTILNATSSEEAPQQ